MPQRLYAVTSAWRSARRPHGWLNGWLIGNPVSDTDLRHNSLDALRLLLALLVIISHAYPLSGTPDEPLAVLSKWHLTLGEVAVIGFFTLSGYLITRSYEQLASLPRFLWHRLLRIMPGFWVCLLVTALVIAPVMAHLAGMKQGTLWSAPDGPLAYIQANWDLQMRQYGIAGLPTGVAYPRAIDGSLWSLWVEFRCYIAVAIIGALGVLQNCRWIVVLLTVALVAALVATVVDPTILQQGPQSALLQQWMDPSQLALDIKLWCCFFIGATAYLYRRFLPLSPVGAAIAFVCFIVFSRTAFEPVGTVFFLSYAVLTVGFRLGVRQTAHLRRVGDLSYGTYIYAFPVQQILALVGLAVLPVGLYGLLGMVITLPIAYASYHLIEAPFLRLKSLGAEHKPSTRKSGSEARRESIAVVAAMRPERDTLALPQE